MLLLKLIPTHQVAGWLLSTIDGLLNKLGLAQYRVIEEIIYIFIISLISVIIGILLKKFIIYVTHRMIAVKHSAMAIELQNRKVFTDCSHIIPPLVFMGLIPFAFNSDSEVLEWIFKIVGIYTLIAFALGMNSILEFIFDRYNQNENRKNLPLRGVRNIAIGIVWIIIVILSVSILLDKSPGTLLAGLGAFAAALLLIFKDSILGFVAGIQMSDNDMLHVGDWIIVPGTPANGIVQDVSLSTVKILNWNLVTVMVPPYTLVSTSFQNYKSMYDSNCRQIKNSIIIDVTSVKPVDDNMIADILKKHPELSDFVANLKQKGNTAAIETGLQAVNGTIETNLGLFRAYACIYLTNNPGIAKTRRVLVRLMENTNAGIPLQLWFFTNTTDWGEYESILSSIMEHLTSVVSDFGGLAIYSGTTVDVQDAGYADRPLQSSTTATSVSQ